MAADPLAHPPGQRQAGHGADAGQGPHGDGAVAEELYPAVEDGVVQGRGTVVAEGLGQLRQGQCGDVDRERFVEPEM